MTTIQIVKELATAVSTQAQVANRFWITLMTVALFALLPRIGSPEAQTINLPLGLGAVAPASLNPVLFAVLVVLIVAFAAAHSQQVRAQKLAQDYIDTVIDTDDGVHPRELFDMLRQPSVTRVSPLAQSLRGKFQFIATEGNCPAVLWWSGIDGGAMHTARFADEARIPVWVTFPNTKVHDAEINSGDLPEPQQGTWHLLCAKKAFRVQTVKALARMLTDLGSAPVSPPAPDTLFAP